MTVATFPAAKLWRGTEQFDAWLEWYGKDSGGSAATYPWAERFLSDPSSYYGGRKDARILEWGAYSLALSDRTGQLQGTTLGYSIRNDDQLIGAWQDNAFQSAFFNTQNVIRAIFEADRLAGLDPAVIFRGLVKGTASQANFKVQVRGVDWLSARIAQNVPLWRVGTDFGAADKFPPANAELKGPLVYGTLSDEGSTTGAPTIVADDAAHLSMDGTTGIGDLPTAPAGVVVAENVGGGTINLGDVPADGWYVGVTRVVAGVESQMNGRRGDENSVTIANDSAAIDASCTADGADSYRFYLGFLEFGRIIFTQMIESATPSVTFTDSADASEVAGSTPASWPITSGAVLTNVLQRWMAISAEMPDGETVLCARKQYTGFPYARPARIAFAPVVGALSYHAYSSDSPTDGPFTRHKTVLTSQVNGDSNVYVQDSWTTAEWDVISTLKTPVGKVPGFYVGRLPDTTGFLRHAFAFAASAIKGFKGIYLTTAGVATKVDPADYGVTWYVPGQTGYSTYYATPYYDTTNGHRWTVVYVDGPDADAIIAGTSTVAANLDGIEDVGDGSGTLLTSGIDQLAHFLDNFVLADASYAGGLWTTTVPTWADGASRRDTDSFDYLTGGAYSTSITSGDLGAWLLNTASRTVDVLALLMVSFDLAYGFTKAGQCRIVLLPPDVSKPDPIVDLTEISHLEEDSVTWDDQTDPAWFWNTASFSALPTFTATGPTYTFTGSVTDDAAQATYGILPDSFTAAFFARQAIAPVDEIMARRLARASTAPRVANATTSLNGLAIEIGDVVTVSHREASSANGWTAHRVQVLSLAIDLQAQRVSITGLDIERTTAFDIEERLWEGELGGSWHESPALSGADPEAIDAYEFRDVRVRWSVLAPGDSAYVFVNAKVDSGLTLTPIIWNLTDAIEADYIHSPKAVTAGFFVQQIIELARPAGGADKVYRLKATVTGGAVDLRPWFLGTIRYATAAEALADLLVTVPSGKVGSDLTDFPLYIDLSTLPSRFWDGLAFDDGRDIRVRTSDGNAEVPFDLLSMNAATRTGALFVKISLAQAADVSIRISFGDAERSAVPVTDPNGRNAVWVDYHRVWFFGIDDSWADRAGNGPAPVPSGSVSSFTQAAISADTGGHQGVEWDGAFFYTVNTNGLKKWDAAFSMVLASNSNPVASVPGTDHLGDCCVVGDTLYVGMQFYDEATTAYSTPHIARFRTSDLSFISAVDITSDGHAAGNLCYVADEDAIYMVVDGDETVIYRYDRSTLTALSNLTLSAHVTNMNGITLWKNRFWVNSMPPGTTPKRTWAIDRDGTVAPAPALVFTTSSFWEGITHNDSSLFSVLSSGIGHGVVYQLDPVAVEAGAGARLTTNALAAANGHAKATGLTRFMTWTVGLSLTVRSKGGSNETGAQYTVAGATDDSIRTLMSWHQATDRFGIWNSVDGWLDGLASPTTGTIYRLHDVHNGTTSRAFFENGVQQAIDLGITAMPGATANAMYFGVTSDTETSVLDGTIGFVYLRASALSADWIAAEVANLHAPGTFYTVGD